MRTIAEIGNDRLINVLVRDKNQSPARILNILKSEITEIFNSYAELDDEISINMTTERGRVSFEIKAIANRIKDFGQIAE
jgi:septum formation topological specificity factor MinE